MAQRAKIPLSKESANRVEEEVVIFLNEPLRFRFNLSAAAKVLSTDPRVKIWDETEYQTALLAVAETFPHTPVPRLCDLVTVDNYRAERETYWRQQDGQVRAKAVVSAAIGDKPTAKARKRFYRRRYMAICSAIAAGEARKAVAEKFGVSLTTVATFLKREARIKKYRERQRQLKPDLVRQQKGLTS